MNRGLSVLSILDVGQKKRGLWERELEAKTFVTSSYISHGDLRNRSMKGCSYFRVNVNSILARSRPKGKTKEKPNFPLLVASLRSNLRAHFTAGTETSSACDKKTRWRW